MNTRQFLLESGILPNLKGYRYILSAVEIVKAHPDLKLCGEDGVYGIIANQNKASNSKVERAIRHAIQTMRTGTLSKHCKYWFKNDVPTNKEFICLMADVMEG